MGIKEYRKRTGTTQTELAKKIGVSVYTLQLWERGATKPNEENMVKLKKVMGEK